MLFKGLDKNPLADRKKKQHDRYCMQKKGEQNWLESHKNPDMFWLQAIIFILVLVTICLGWLKRSNVFHVMPLRGRIFNDANSSIQSFFVLNYIGVSKNRGTPKWMVYNGKPYLNGWFGGTLILGNIHIGARSWKPDHFLSWAPDCWNISRDAQHFSQTCSNRYFKKNGFEGKLRGSPHVTWGFLGSWGVGSGNKKVVMARSGCKKLTEIGM